MPVQSERQSELNEYCWRKSPLRGSSELRSSFAMQWGRNHGLNRVYGASLVGPESGEDKADWQ